LALWKLTFWNQKFQESIKPQALLFTLHEYIKQERPYFTDSSDYEDDRLDSLLRPDEDDSTELGDVPHSDTKGSLDSKVRPYGFQYNYSLIREGESEDS